MDDFNKQFDPFNSGAMPQATPQPEPQVQPQFPQANEIGQPMDQSFQIQDPMQNTQPQAPQVPSVETAFQPQFQEPSFQQPATSSSQDFNASFAAPVQEKKSEETPVSPVISPEKAETSVSSNLPRFSFQWLPPRPCPGR